MESFPCGDRQTAGSFFNHGIDMTGKVELKGMKFFAHHGCFHEEKIIGNHFVVDFSAEMEVGKAAASDDLDDALNYQLIFDIVKEEMAVSSNLLEHVGGRIVARVVKSFPQIRSGYVAISKLNPPLGGQVDASKVTLFF